MMAFAKYLLKKRRVLYESFLFLLLFCFPFFVGAQVSITATALTSCGNGVVNSGEQCDGSDFGSVSCTTFGFTGGTLACRANCLFNVSSCTSNTTNNTGGGGGSSGGGGGSAGVSIPSSFAQVVVSGRAYPLSRVSVLKDGKVAATTIAGSDANFNVTLNNVSLGSYLISVSSEDLQGNRSLLFNFPVSVNQPSVIKITGVFLAPTIQTDKTEVKRGDNIIISGYGFPESDVTIGVSSDEETFYKTKTSEKGFYLYTLDTSNYELGSHQARAKTILPAEVSSFSETIGFTIGSKNVLKKKENQCRKGDMNCDGRVNLIDFSVMSYWFHRSSPPKTVDVNGDGKVNLIDFSILAYYWSG